MLDSRNSKSLVKRCLLITALIAIFPNTVLAHNGTPIYPMVFPVLGSSSYTDTFGAPRSGGRTHKGADIFGVKGQALVAAAPGTVTGKSYGQLGGYMLTITDYDGNSHFYAHLNNDSKGTDDGKGGEKTAYAAGISVGTAVRAGQLVAFLGDSGNAEGTPPHLHYEIRPSGSDAVCPNHSLNNAKRVSAIYNDFVYSNPDKITIKSNPFSPNGDYYTDKANFKYDLSKKANITFRILNYKGPVARIVTSSLRQAGANALVWNGRGLIGNVLADGTYLYEIIAKAGNGLTKSVIGKITIKKSMLPPGNSVPAVTSIKATPNPFSPTGKNNLAKTTTISYSLSTDAIITARLFNYKGEVKTVHQTRYRMAGSRHIVYNGTNNTGVLLPAGNYRLEISARNDKGITFQNKTIGIK